MQRFLLYAAAILSGLAILFFLDYSVGWMFAMRSCPEVEPFSRVFAQFGRTLIYTLPLAIVFVVSILALRKKP